MLLYHTAGESASTTMRVGLLSESIAWGADPKGVCAG